eukprot:CAMPEP_0201554412 /NCGR_PEP_ID=MMETSP0173_2-20130828/40639_1 /ASSEMBLY_ACC=CAM_ASM_000268 /TAXON_ID=218659 /ORGANISM="Vexillifera sp., Strain DIVA3 564/2" /LENGTH=328 /DNA_ID=CAMNT_0047965683 /DNA_START=66 /DNA_END=1048 /DNA_ORIENTATION=+
MTTQQGIQRLGKYISSIGRFTGTPTPFLFPLYGISEFPQAFSRLAAVNGGLYILRRGFQQIVGNDQDPNQVKGIVCSEGQSLDAKDGVIATESYVPSTVAQKYFANASSSSSILPPESISRCIAIVDKSLRGDEPNEGKGNIYITIPPSDVTNNSVAPISVLQLGSSMLTCPAGFYYVSFSTESSGQTAQKDLGVAVDTLLNRDVDNPSSTKPNVLFCVFFNVQQQNSIKEEKSFPSKGLFITKDASTIPLPDLFEAAASQAFHIFQQLCPDAESFLPKREQLDEYYVDVDDDVDVEQILKQTSTGDDTTNDTNTNDNTTNNNTTNDT